VSKSERIAKLESLLARVRARANEPRRRPVALAAAPAPAPAPAPVPPVAWAPAVAPAPAVSLRRPAPPIEIEEVDAETIPPPPSAPAQVAETTQVESVLTIEATDVESVLEADVTQDAGEPVIGVGAEEVVVAESFGSRERLVAAAPVPLEPVPAAVAEVLPPAELLEESPPELLAAVEEVEEAPASSRRPVAPEPEERLADMAFGAEEPSPPRHTPPPESGRLPAAPAVEFDGDVTGVRDASPIPPRTRELVPESTRAELVPSDAVADVVGEAQRFAPSTFAALLDASLAL
jgi:hypothetical protein